jgi:DNA-directed RNA polymerase subunit H (RpoH/RPB5)
MEKSFRQSLNVKNMEDRALATIKTMLNERNLKVEQPESLGSPVDDTKMYNFGGVLVIFSEKTRVSDNNLTAYIKFALENNYTNGTIVISQIPSSESVLNSVRKYINKPENPMLQIFDIRSVGFNRSLHVKVPRHRILAKNEISELEVRYNISKAKEQLPWIDSQDPMAKWVGARPGDIIEIIRFSESAGASPYYRYCVANVSDT